MSSSKIWPHLADRADIIAWAGKYDSGSQLPTLIRRLIRTDNDRVSKLNMRAEEGVWLPGYDGQVHAQAATPFVPAGESIWEMGTNSKYLKKAEEDYEKRTAKPGTVIPSNTTFVFVTPHSWSDKDSWVASKAGGPWKSVVVHDVDSICEALERAFELHCWFTGSIGHFATGIQTLEIWWDAFSTSEIPPLEVTAVLNGREASAGQLLALIEAEKRTITLQIETIDELLAFYYASITNCLPDDQDLLFSRSLIVKDADAIRYTSLAENHLALVPFDESLYREAKTLGRHSLLLVENHAEFVDLIVPGRVNSEKAIPDKGAKEFSMPLSEVVAASARDSGEDEEKRVERVATGPVMLRTFSSWKIRILWLLGSWSLDRSGDKALLEQLANKTWAELLDELNAANDIDFPTFKRIGDSWTVSDVSDSWFYLKPKLTSSDLDVFSQALQIVLGAVDPAANSTVTELWESTLYGTERIYSRDLRTGVSDTLAFLAAQGEAFELSQGITLKNWVSQTVQNLLRRANKDVNGNLWESLGELFSLLAEAAPMEFMSEIKLGLASDGSLFKKLFTDSPARNARSISNTQVNLLFALEVLVWKSEYLGLATEIMSILTELDADGKSGNAPAKSLTTTFLPWLPQTNTPVDRQLIVVDGIIQRHPIVGWNLILSLLPTSNAIAFPSSGPKFNIWKPENLEPINVVKYFEITTDILNRAMKMADTNRGYWVELVKRLDSLSPLQKQSVITNLRIYSTKTNDEPERFEIFEELTQLVRRHREFPAAKWAMDEELLSELWGVAELFASDSLELKSLWLFNDQRPDLGIAFSDDDLPYQNEILRQRKEACEGIYEQSGLQGVTEFAIKVRYPYFLGRSLGSLESTAKSIEVMNLIDSENYQLVNFAVGFIDEILSGGEQLLNSLAEFPDRPLLSARILSRLNNFPEIWEITHDLGSEIDKLYWEEFQIAGRGADFGYANEVARHLLDHHLALKAIDVLSLYGGRGVSDVDVNLVFDALETYADSGDVTEDSSTHVSWTLGHLLERLVREGVDPSRVAILEWKLLPALGYGYKPSSIENLLASNPDFFTTIMCFVYKSEDDSEIRTVDPVSSRKAFQALFEWSQVPGSDAPGMAVDAEKLKIWVERVRELAERNHRSNVAETLIGQILAHSNSDEDGSWPSKPIRDLIESSPSEKLGDGFVIGTRNLRGVHTRGLEDGGQQEHALAEKFETWKNLVADGWPTVGLLLERVAESYKLEGRREDERAQLWEEGLDR